MRIVLFCHSILSDWNHGNAHFLRGIASELLDRDHEVEIYEPADSWSLKNLLAEHGAGAIDDFHAAYPRLASIRYNLQDLDLDRVLNNADLVIVHEWNDPQLIRLIGEHHSLFPSYKLLFHDTHHRAVSDAASIQSFDLSNYDGVLAFGESLGKLYISAGWATRVWTWHEAADTLRFRAMRSNKKLGELVWIGNWGDDERAAEIEEFLIRPVENLGIQANVYGVRYPQHAVERLEAAGIKYSGWLPNFRVPEVFAAHHVTVHIPRRPYASKLPGIPTIRPFEALACEIPLVCSPWEDTEHLFTRGKDLLVASDGKEMQNCIERLLYNPGLAQDMAEHGGRTVKERHTCAHRVDELLSICEEIDHSNARSVSA